MVGRSLVVVLLKFLPRIISIIANLLFLRLIDPAELGYYTVVLVVFEILQTVSEYGTNLLFAEELQTTSSRASTFQEQLLFRLTNSSVLFVGALISIFLFNYDAILVALVLFSVIMRFIFNVESVFYSFNDGVYFLKREAIFIVLSAGLKIFILNIR